MKHKKGKENFKCLICGTRFSVEKSRYDKFKEQMDQGTHIDDVERIECKKCNASQVQHLDKITKQQNNKTGKNNKFADFLGKFFGNIISPFVVYLNIDKLLISREIIVFSIFLLQVFIINKLTNLDFIYSISFVLIYSIIDYFRRR